MSGFAEELVQYFKRFHEKGLPYGLSDAQIERLYNQQKEFVVWLKHQISNHDSFGSIDDEQLVNLKEPYWSELIDYAAEHYVDNSDNKSAELVLFEAKHYNYLPSKYEHLKASGFSQRLVDKSVTHAWAISFEINGPHHKNPKHLVGDGYSRFEKWDKMAGIDVGPDVPYKDMKDNWRWLYNVALEEDDNRSFHRYADGEIVQHEFGGYIQGLEAKRINRLLTLDPIPPHLPITGLSQLTLGMDYDKIFQLSIMIDKPAYYQHDEQGIPHIALTDVDYRDIDFYRCAPIKRGKVLLYELPQKYLHHDRGNMWRIGGSPMWWQKPEVPTCIKCSKPMAFLANLPSGEMRTIENKIAYYGSDGGTAYGWWCDDDKISCYTWQDT